MAGAEEIVDTFVIEKPEIPKRLLDGTKFLKWSKSDGDECAVPITLRVDENGFLLYWKEPNKDTETLEISNIRDARYGKYAKEPKEWADYLLTTAYHPTTRHISVATSIEKAYTKLKLETNHAGEIPVKKLMKLLGGRSSRVESALQAADLPTSAKKTIDPEEFPLNRFKKLLRICSPCQELDTVFASLGSGARRIYITQQKFQEFINTVQRDPKLNEILHPLQNEDQTMEQISTYETNLMFAQKGQLTQDGLDSYLQSDDNFISEMKSYTLYQDMGQYLSHYFINSSHNTYLPGNQYSSRSSAEMYRQVLLSGCRCVELDCWEGDDEPVINHGFTFCTPVPFKDVIEAIDEAAFKTSPYPVVLSFENHVESKTKQAKMAQYCRDIFKEKLLLEPLTSHPIEPGKMLPSPKELLYKIIIKNKKQRVAPTAKQNTEVSSITPSSPSNPLAAPSNTPQELESRPSGRSKSTDYGCTSRALHVNPDDTEDPQLLNGIVNPTLAKQKFFKTNSAPNMVVDQSNKGLDLNCTNHFDCEAEEFVNSSLKLETLLESLPEEGLEEEEMEGSECTSPCADGPLLERVARVAREKENGGGAPSSPTRSGNHEDGASKDVIDEDLNESEEDDANGDDRDGESAYKESAAYEAMSSLVNYIQPVRFKNFSLSEKHNRSYEISSFTETSALNLITESPVEYVRYNRRQTSRIYPRGSRVDSSNYMPQVFWNVGCQFVSLNFQTLDLPMQLNLAMFEFNGGCGYLLKPEYMCRKDRSFDPFARNIDGVVPTSLTIRIISGQFLSQQKISTYVEVDMFGLPSDTKLKKFKTKTVDGNPTNPRYDSPAFEFKQIALPSLAMLRISVSDTGGNLVGQRYLRVEGLKPGYRYITLRNKSNQPLLLSSVFVFLRVEDFVPPAHKVLAEMLVDPISFLPPEEREFKKRQERESDIREMIGVDEDDAKSDIVEADGIVEIDEPGSGSPQDSFQPPKKDFLVPGPRSIDFEQRKGGTLRPISKKPSPNLGYYTLPARTKVRGRDFVMGFLQEFSPQTLNDLKLGKPYKRLEKEREKMLNKLKKKNAHQFITQYRVLYGVRRRSSVLSALKKVTITKRKSSASAEACSKVIKPDEEKRKEMTDLFRSHLVAEKEFQISEIANFIKNFEHIVKLHQKYELKKLRDMSDQEQMDIQKRKNLEKQNKIRDLSGELSRQELIQRKRQIDEEHFNECVQDRTLLSNKQKERKNAIVQQQKEIIESLSSERDAIREKIEKEYEEKLNNMEELFDIFCFEQHLIVTSANGTTSHESVRGRVQRTAL